MRLSDFDFSLPQDRIALRPVYPRDAAKLLHVGAAGDLSDRKIRDLPMLLRAGDVLVVNQSRVIPAALTAVRAARQPGGADIRIHINLVERCGDDIWHVYAKPGRRLVVGDVLRLSDDTTLQVRGKHGDGRVTVQFSVSGAALDEVLDRIGQMPLPPYIADRRPADLQDRVDYQTLYAADAGSVAAPTAGLHFTPELLQSIDAMGVERLAVTLHVGAGTFLPVKTVDIATHVMHSEWGCVTPEVADAIARAQREGRRVIAVGTTAARILEAAAQQTGNIRAFSGNTAIFITPGFDFKVVDVLMTNFHLPQSTLFMLVCAMAGIPAMQAAYAHAIAHDYRFYSYGDACFIERAQ